MSQRIQMKGPDQGREEGRSQFTILIRPNQIRCIQGKEGERVCLTYITNYNLNKKGKKSTYFTTDLTM